jgi:hypothetical protein
VNRDEIKKILLLYRPGTADAEDSRVSEALALAKADAELARWLDEHCARQSALGAKFRQIEPPAGLLEQIISEHAASRRALPERRKVQLMLAMLLGLLTAAAVVLWPPHRVPDDTLTVYQNQMVRVALSPYSMEFTTNAPAPIRGYLAEKHAPADFMLSAALEHTAMIGCAVENWQGVKVSMICFRTSRALPQDAASDLWLFVVDRAAVKNAPEGNLPQVAKVNRLVTATWSHGDKLYFLGTLGDESTLKQYL